VLYLKVSSSLLFLRIEILINVTENVYLMVLNVNGVGVDYGVDSSYVVFTGDPVVPLADSFGKLATFADLHVNGTGEGIEARWGDGGIDGESRGEVRIRPFSGSRLDLSLDQSMIEILESSEKGCVRFLYDQANFAISDGVEDSYQHVEEKVISNTPPTYSEFMIIPDWPRINTASQLEISPEEVDNRIENYITFFKALALPERVRIIHGLYTRGEMGVDAIQEYARQNSQPATSKNLAILGSVGLIKRRRDGKHRFYSLNQERLGRILFNLYNETDVQNFLGIQATKE